MTTIQKAQKVQKLLVTFDENVGLIKQCKSLMNQDINKIKIMLTDNIHVLTGIAKVDLFNALKKAYNIGLVERLDTITCENKDIELQIEELLA